MELFEADSPGCPKDEQAFEETYNKNKDDSGWGDDERSNQMLENDENDLLINDEPITVS